MDLLHNLYTGFTIALTWQNLLCCTAGVFFGQLIGILPGIGAPTAIALLLPLTFSLNPTSAIIMFAGIYYGVAYGGTITSILINVPGESSSVMTCVDGYAMAQKGRAGAALSIAAIGSFIAGTISIVLLDVLCPGAGQACAPFRSGGILRSRRHGLRPAHGLRQRVAFQDHHIHRRRRFDLDGRHGRRERHAPASPSVSLQLLGGIDFIVIICGIFGLAEVFNSIEEPEGGYLVKEKFKLSEVFLTWQEWVESRWAIVRGGVIGFLIGLIPAGGITTASFLAYMAEKNASKHPETFGKGDIAGVAAPESANNAASISGFAPLLALGVPGSATTAVMLAGFMMWGIRPGPLLFTTKPDLVWGLIASMYVGNVILLLMNIFLIPLFVAMLRIPYSILMGFIIIFASIGAYSVNNSMFDVWMMVGFGLLGYAMKKLKYPIVPLILAMVLGNLVEKSLRQALVLSAGSFDVFYTRPITAVFLLIALLAYCSPLIRMALRKAGYGKAAINVESL